MEFYKVKLQMIKEQSIEYDTKITSPRNIVDFINKKEQYNLSPNEKFIVIGLDTKGKINVYSEIAEGSPECCGISIPNIFKILLISNSVRFIVVHNHPSGSLEPSKYDLDITKKIQECANIMDLLFLDHIIIADNDYISIK